MSDWSEGYYRDLPYTHGFRPLLAPSRLWFTVAACGREPPGLGRFSYCELGCGQGLTANILAAANPQGEFWAVDFHPEHVAGARRLAAEAGLGNIRFLEASFEEFLEQPTPEFDFIVLHGVYSWVVPKVRAALIEVLHRKLVAGGVVFISYNCLPGWASVVPLRQLLVQGVRTSGAAPAAAIEQTVQLIAELAEEGARYFGNNPGAAELARTLPQKSPNYIAHEYLNEAWRPFFCSDVARDLARAKLTYVGAAEFWENFDSLALSPAQQATLGRIQNPAMREMARDFILNRHFRQDVFARGAGALGPEEYRERMESLRYALVRPLARATLEASLPTGKVQLKEEFYQPLLEALATHGPCRPDDLRPHLPPALAEPRKLLEALCTLVAVGYATPCLPGPPDASRRARVAALNAALLAHPPQGQALRALASPETGDGVALHPMETSLLAARATSADPVEAVRALLAANPAADETDGPAATPEDLRLKAENIVARFETERLGVLRGLGVTD